MYRFVIVEFNFLKIVRKTNVCDIPMHFLDTSLRVTADSEAASVVFQVLKIQNYCNVKYKTNGSHLSCYFEETTEC